MAANQGDTDAQSILARLYEYGYGVAPNKIAAAALRALVKRNTDDSGTGNEETKPYVPLSITEQKQVERLAEAMFKSNKPIDDLTEFVKRTPQRKPAQNPKIYEQPSRRLASQQPSSSLEASSHYPNAPERVPGVVSCRTHCVNGDCYRTYGDGRKVHFQAHQKWDPFENTFTYDSGSC